MPRGSKDKYTDAQKRKAEHIEASYEDKGVPKDQAEARAWATVNKQSGGGERAGGSGRATSEGRKSQARKDSAKRAVATKHGVPRGQSLGEESKASLMQKARAKNIAGRSSMRKQELVEALRKAS
ncbi:Rho termination factor N-terminal domain-containing protein [Aquipseudomonas campi]